MYFQVNTKLENDIDKYEIKLREAQHITWNYRQIIDTLGDDTHTYNARIEVMQKALQQQRKEVFDLSFWAQQAHVSQWHCTGRIKVTKY